MNVDGNPRQSRFSPFVLSLCPFSKCWRFPRPFQIRRIELPSDVSSRVIPSERSESRNRSRLDREPFGQDDRDSSTSALRAFAYQAYFASSIPNPDSRRSRTSSALRFAKRTTAAGSTAMRGDVYTRSQRADR